MKKIAIIMVAILTSLFFINCSADSGETAFEEPANELVGTWQGVGNEQGSITFKSDGTFKEDDLPGDLNMEGTYTIDEMNKTVVCIENEYGITYDYAYTITGNELTLQMEYGFPRTFMK